MNFPKTVQDVIYRLILLRRLTALCALLVCLGAAFPLLQQGAPLWPLVPLGVACLLGFAVYNTLFPGGFVDAIGFAVSASGLAALGYSGLDLGWGAHMAIAVCLYAAAVWALHLLEQIDLRGKTVSYQAELPVSAETAAQILFTRPNSRNKSLVHGPADADGLIPVWMVNLNFHLAEDGVRLLSESEKLAGPPDFYTHILEQEPLVICEQSIIETPAAGAEVVSAVARTEITPLGDDRCLYHATELTDAFSVVSWITWWLRDAPRDLARDYTDQVTGGPDRAIRHVQPLGLVSLCVLWLQSKVQTNEPG